MPRKLTALATAALIGLGLNCGVAPASAFGEAGHRLITVAGLSPGGTETWSPTFLNGPVIEDINNEHEWMDKDFPWSTNGGQDELHFDDCEFDESISRINGPWPGLFGLSG